MLEPSWDWLQSSRKDVRSATQLGSGHRYPSIANPPEGGLDFRPLGGREGLEGSPNRIGVAPGNPRKPTSLYAVVLVEQPLLPQNLTWDFHCSRDRTPGHHKSYGSNSVGPHDWEWGLSAKNNRDEIVG